MVRFDLSNFVVNFRHADMGYRDRTDLTWSGYGYWKFKPKTSAFVEYDFLNVRYDTSDMNDSREHNFYAGLKWDMTAKSKGRIKVLLQHIDG